MIITGYNSKRMHLRRRNMAIRKVCVAMSGGVDSAGAALLLRQQ